jgi:hypothetical protein
MSDGTEIYCEQTTHHPPASNYQVVGPDNLYHFYGRGLCSASARGNTLKGYFVLQLSLRLFCLDNVGLWNLY